MNSSTDTLTNKKRTQIERTAISDEKMFEAAIKLILERGTQKTTLKDIGEIAGYSRGLANYRFGTKSGLFNELIRLLNHRWSNELQKNVKGKSGIAALMEAIKAFESFLLFASDELRVMYILWFESVGYQAELHDKLARVHSESRRDIQCWIEQAIEQDQIDPSVNAKFFAEQYCSFAYGLVYQWLVNPEDFDIKGLFADYKQNILTILRVKIPVS